MLSINDISQYSSGNWQINAGIGVFGTQVRNVPQRSSQRELYNQLFKIERMSFKPELANRIKDLETLYIFSNINDVGEFIKKHDYLIDILFEGQIRINEIFGHDIEKYLEVTTDPEENYRELFIVIRTKYNPQNARKLMDKLDKEWFLQKISQTKGKLCITEEPL